MKWATSLVAVCLALSALPAFAQDEGRVGLTMGYPSTVGVLWQVSDRVALRPEVSFSHTSTELERPSIEPAIPGSFGDTAFGETETSTGASRVAVGLTALFYVRRWDGLRAYLSPRFEYSRASSDLESTLGALPISTSTEISTRGYSFSGSFGVQYTLARHFGLFGETGLEYSSSKTKAFFTETEGSSVGTRNAVGVIFYF